MVIWGNKCSRESLETLIYIIIDIGILLPKSITGSNFNKDKTPKINKIEESQITQLSMRKLNYILGSW